MVNGGNRTASSRQDELGAWIRKGYPLVLGAIRRRGLAAGDAEDAVQDALLGLLNGRQDWDSYDKFLAYFHTAARWRAVDFWRAKARLPISDSERSGGETLMEEHPANSGDPEFAVFEKEVEQAIDGLPERSREVLRMSMSGMNSFEIARKLAMKPASVRSILRFARYRLAARMEDGGPA